MDLSTGSAKLHFALKNLRLHWQHVQMEWNDAVRKQFEEQYVEALETQISSTLGEMNRLEQTIQKAHRECS